MQLVKISNAPTNRVLPTHELNGRRRRKQVIAPQTPSQQAAPKANAAARETNNAAVGHLYSQFPSQGPLA